MQLSINGTDRSEMVNAERVFVNELAVFGAPCRAVRFVRLARSESFLAGEPRDERKMNTSFGQYWGEVS